MSKRDDILSIRDMLNHAQEAADMVRGIDRNRFQSNRMLQLALTRLVEIVGEAAKRVTAQTQGAHSEIPWSDIIGMRNRLIHGYDLVDLDVLWETVTADLPSLAASLQRLLEK